MAFHLIASHIQHEREAEAAREQLVRLVRASARTPSRGARARAAIGLAIVELGLALGGEGARRRAREATGTRSVAA